MHGGKRAPRFMSALEEGPNIGFIVGYVIFSDEFGIGE
jgi:hypothetical protein